MPADNVAGGLAVSRRPMRGSRSPQLYAKAKGGDPPDDDTNELSDGVLLNLTLVGMCAFLGIPQHPYADYFS